MSRWAARLRAVLEKDPHAECVECAECPNPAPPREQSTHSAQSARGYSSKTDDGEAAHPRPIVGADGADPHPPGAQLLVRHLWPRGIEVKAEDDAVVLVAPRIPPVLVAAVRRHLPAVAAWVCAPAGAGLVVKVTP